MGLHISKAASVAIAAGDIRALNGRRYKVKTAAATNGRFTLTETSAGGQLLVGGYVHADTKTAVATATAAGGTHSTGTSGTITMSGGSNNGILCANTAGATCTALTTQTRALFREINANGYVGSKITEVATAAPFQYVS